MVARSITRASRVRDPAAADAGIHPDGQNHPQEEQEVSQGRGENLGAQLPSPPPPPFMDLAQIIHNQTHTGDTGQCSSEQATTRADL